MGVISFQNCKVYLVSCDFEDSSVTVCPTFHNPMDCSTPGFPVPHHLLEFAQVSVHWIVMPSNHRIFCHSLLLLPSIFPSIKVFSNGHLFTSGGQSIGTSASVLPMNILGWFPLRLTDLISLLSKGTSRVFSSTTVQKHPFFGALPSLLCSSYIRTWLLESP